MAGGQRIRQPGVIVDKDADLSPCSLNASISPPAHASVLVQYDQLDLRETSGHHGCGVVFGPVVDDDQLLPGIVLFPEAGKTVTQLGRSIPGNDDIADKRRFHVIIIKW